MDRRAGGDDEDWEGVDGSRCEMEQAFAVLGGAFIGGSAMLCSGIVVEAFRRHRDRRAIALVIAGEISALTNRSAPRPLIQQMAAPGQGESSSFPGEAEVLAPIAIERVIDRVGLLGGDLPFRIAAYLAHLRRCRAMSASQANKDSALANWREAHSLGEALMTDLLALSEEPFAVGLLGRRARPSRRGIVPGWGEGSNVRSFVHRLLSSVLPQATRRP
jgi:hypothetical protein